MDNILETIKNSPEYLECGSPDLEKIYDKLIDEKLDDVIKKAVKNLRKNISELFRYDNICFLTGNGSSIYAGTKITTKFNCADYFDINDSNEKSILDFIQNESLEKVLNNLIIMLNYYSLTNNTLMYNLVEKKIKDIEKNFIANNVEGIDYSYLNFHEVFIRKLRSIGAINKTNIYTLNYDLAFEYALDKLGVEYNTGFTGFINRNFDGRSLEKNNNPNIIKLHGSLNWYIDDNGYDIKERQPVFKNGKIEHEEGPYLIYPTSNKFIDSQNYPFSELLRNFLDNISNKKTVLFILGYKFEDSHVNDVIRKSLLNPNLIIYVFNYKADNQFLNELKQLSKNDERIKYFDSPFIADFRTFVTYLMPSTNEKSELEIIREILSGVKYE